MDRIFTLNARGNIFLEALRDHFRLTPKQMHREIRALFDEASDALTTSGIKYDQLNTALVPSTDRDELALFFDTEVIDSCTYGHEVLCRVLPLLDKRTTQSVLVGDLIGGSDDQQFIFDSLVEHLVPIRNFTFVHSTLIYCVYLNNVTKASARHIVEGLVEFDAFFGYISTTFASRIKTMMSFWLCNLFVKRGSVVVLAHEDDRPNTENVNITSYPFEQFGYQVRSIQQQHFSHFLSFKIEREVVSGFQTDTEFSLNALSTHIENLSSLDILIEPSKLEYIKREKAGSLERAGIHALDAEGIKKLIRGKLAHNYIYNLRYLDDHDVMLFNIILEVARPDGGYPSRLLLSLEYQPAEGNLRVVTMY